MIVKDQIATLVASSALALGLIISCSGAAGAAVSAAQGPPSSNGASAEAEPVAITMVENGIELQVSTVARTVGALLDERADRPAVDDRVSPAADEPLTAGMRVVYRQAVPVQIRVGRETFAVRSAAATVGELLADQHIDVAPGDEVSPGVTQAVSPNAVVRVVRVSRWTSQRRQSIAPALKQTVDSHLALGTSRVVARGNAGVRETTIRFVKRDDGKTFATVLATRILRVPHAKIVVRGARTYQSLAHVAELGFASAVHFAGSALHMIASAYTAGCYGCTGMTASGLRAGFGIIAVDPSIIPLGSKLFIPGYGRAIAGDTGGAIRGHRIDLGFNSDGEALQWGNRPVTVYLLR